MATNLGEKRRSSFDLQARERALRYDDLASVLIIPDEQVHLPAKRKRDRNSGADPAELAELRANVAFLKAENERLAERVTEELDRVTERLTELEARVHRSWWRRAFGRSGSKPEPVGRPRRKAIARLRALGQNRSDLEYRPS